MINGNKTTIVLLGIATFFMLFSVGIYTFLFVSIKNKSEKNSVVSEKIDELSGKESRIAASVAVLRRANDDVEKLSTFFFKENEVVSFAKKIEELGAQSKTSLSIEALEPGGGDKNVPIINLRIKATGNFEDVMRLLVLLENFPGKFEWKSVRLSRESLSPEVDPNEKKSLKIVTLAPTWRVEVGLVALNFINK